MDALIEQFNTNEFWQALFLLFALSAKSKKRMLFSAPLASLR